MKDTYLGEGGILENIPQVLKVAPKNIYDNAGPDKALQLQIFENLHEGEEISLLSLASKSFAFYTYLVVWMGLDALLLHQTSKEPSLKGTAFYNACHYSLSTAECEYELTVMA